MLLYQLTFFGFTVYRGAENLVADLPFAPDALSHLRDLISDLTIRNPQLRALLDMPLQAPFVVDTDWFIRDVRSLARSNQTPDRLTDFQKAVASGTIEPRAPHHLRRELEKHIPRLAQEIGIEEELLR